MVTCDMENVVGKFKNPIKDPSEVPFPDVYSIPENNEPYDCAYFYHKKQYPPLVRRGTGYFCVGGPDAPAFPGRGGRFDGTLDSPSGGQGYGPGFVRSAAESGG